MTLLALSSQNHRNPELDEMERDEILDAKRQLHKFSWLRARGVKALKAWHLSGYSWDYLSHKFDPPGNVGVDGWI